MMELAIADSYRRRRLLIVDPGHTSRFTAVSGASKDPHARLDLAPSFDGELPVQVTTPASGLDGNDCGQQVARVDGTPSFGGTPTAAWLRTGRRAVWGTASSQAGSGGMWRGPFAGEAWIKARRAPE